MANGNERKVIHRKPESLDANPDNAQTYPKTQIRKIAEGNSHLRLHQSNPDQLAQRSWPPS